MFASMRGRLAKKDVAGEVVVDSGTIGYRIFVSLSTLLKLPDEGKEVFLHTVTIVRDNAIHLYGFKDPEEMNIFNLLLLVKGVGPKMALALLGGLKANDLCAAIIREDSEWIRSVPGVGKKTAERIILELKEKVGMGMEASDTMLTKKDKQVVSDVMSALANLGYKQSDSMEAVKKALEEKDESPPFEILIRDCLSLLSGREKHG